MKSHFDPEKEIAEMSDTDWIFGSASQTCLTYTFGMTEDDRWDCLPIGEIQRGAEDTMDCASRAPVNIVETYFTWMYRNNKLLPELRDWLRHNGYVRISSINYEEYIEFSDAWVAINSGTTRSGNSLKAPLEAIRKYGLIPKSILPLEKDMTWDEYHDPQRRTEEMFTLGEEFKKRFTVNYERVHSDAFEALLSSGQLDVAGFAWPLPNDDGEYGPSDANPNHAFALFSSPMSYAYDNYLDNGKPGDFVKKLTKDYIFFPHGYRVFISSMQNPDAVQKDLDILTKLFNLIRNLWQKLRI